jgi:hypothetical protein
LASGRMASTTYLMFLSRTVELTCL